MFNVAIVTPVYNTQDYLHRCIKSVLNQKGVSLQYFIIDDGSTDNSPTIAKHYQSTDARITFISKKNEGQGIARNLGIKLAQAEYIYFVDSDDYLGEGMLKILYETAKNNNLDICSPNVPSHYFSKPLEYVPCIPCKSQFIRLDILREFEILQPNISSGQDGVFSNLVLTHCKRIGMAPKATYHYTHAREGSTFASHLKKHKIIPTLIEQHYNAIEAHYDKYDLWGKNSLRLMWFISNESLRNRLEPHLPYLSTAQKEKVFTILSTIAKKAFKYLENHQKNIILHPCVIELITKSVAYLTKHYKSNLSEKNFEINYPIGSNIANDQLTLCKYYNEKLIPEKNLATKQPSIESTHANQSSNDVRQLKWDLRVLRGKIDLITNTINNATIQITSAIHNEPASTNLGIKGLIASVTTLPHRLPLVHYAIESILNQTLKPELIVLWITDKIDEKKMITPELKSLKKRGLIIKKVRDVGPHTKLVYALHDHPDKKIITFDDDIVYPNNMIQYLWASHIQYPQAVICNWGRELAFDAKGKVLGVRDGKLLTPPTLELEIEQPQKFNSKPNILAFPYGTSGVLYPPKSLHSSVLNVEKFSRLCPKEDDIWFKAMSILNKTPVVVTNLGINPMHHCITGSQQEALRHENHGEGGNLLQMQKVFESLNLYSILNTWNNV